MKGLTGKTGKRLAEMVGGKAIGVVRGEQPDVSDDLVVCWGTWLGRGSTYHTALNRHMRVDKQRELVALYENDIPVPPFESRIRATSVSGSIWRPRQHARSRSFVFVPPDSPVPVSIPESWFGTAFIPSKKEYRIHVAGSNLLLCQRKEMVNESADRIIHSQERGWKFVSFEPNNTQSKLYTIPIKAVSVLDLDFGAVDILMSEGGSYVVSGVNTAPGLTDNSLEKYAEYVTRFAERVDARRTV